MALIIGFLAVVNAIGFFAVVWGFRASRKSVSEATWWFILGFGVLALVLILRGLYWDVALPIFRNTYPDAAAIWRDWTNGRLINITFGIGQTFTIYCILRCRQALIPDDERADWPWWKAWMHPTRFRILPWW